MGKICSCAEVSSRRARCTQPGIEPTQERGQGHGTRLTIGLHSPFENDQGRYAPDPVRLTGGRLSLRIHFDQNGAPQTLRGGLLKGGSKRATRAAPRCPEIGNDWNGRSLDEFGQGGGTDFTDTGMPVGKFGFAVAANRNSRLWCGWAACRVSRTGRRNSVRFQALFADQVSRVHGPHFCKLRSAFYGRTT